MCLRTLYVFADCKGHVFCVMEVRIVLVLFEHVRFCSNESLYVFADCKSYAAKTSTGRDGRQKRS